jgi:MFS transporter, OPA family, glycerol-3-phosphate transporter
VVSPGAPRPGEKEGSWEVVGQVLRRPAVWMLGFSYFAIKLTRYALDLWGPQYVSESLGSDTITSAITAAALPIGGVLGVLVSGYLSDWFFQSRRVPVAVLSLLAAVGCMSVAKMIHIRDAGSMALYFGAIGFFIFGPDASISATAAMDFGTQRGAGTASGFINGIGSIGAVLAGYLPGRITKQTNWAPLFWTFIAGLLISACILLPLWTALPPVGKSKEKDHSKTRKEV